MSGEEPSSGEERPAEHPYGGSPSWKPYRSPDARRGGVLRFLRRHAFLITLVAAVLAVGALIYFSPKRLAPEPDAAGVAPSQETGSGDTYSTLSVYTVPTGARVIVGNDTVGVTPVENRRVPSGTHVVSVAKKGFVNRDTAMMLAADQSAVYAPQLSQEANLPGDEREAPERSTTEDFRPEPTPDPSQTADPSQETASTQESYAGSPSAPGTSPEQTTTQERSASPDSAAEGGADSLVTGTLALSSDPTGATVELNGYRVGTTPVSLDQVAAGTHEVTFTRPGYETVTKRVDVDGTNTVTVEASLPSQTGYLRVLVRPWGSIYVNDQRRMEDADIWYETKLQTGTYTVTARHPTLGEKERAVEVAARDTQSVVLDLREK
ncbi:MAG: PEGA domain-containing protein [Bacteroidetes bacterium QH_2_63_10]|nr:MAG: PEGA domain-containing protein [Bacteroidetes bacterium QH_2_63_10]